MILSFADSGHGIEEKRLAHVFDPFFSTKENGTGFGLTSVMDIVRAHGAHIQVFQHIGYGHDLQDLFQEG